MRILYLLFFTTIIYSSCIKVPIPVTDNGSTTDPNISYYDNYEVDIATYKVDSFLTSGTSVFITGYHLDSAFGRIHATAFVQVNLPADNLVKNKTVIYDSLVMVLKPTAEFYGDSTFPFRLNVHRLLENIKNEEEDNNQFYNPRYFQHITSVIGSTTAFLRPRKGTNITIRLSDVFGQELLTKLKNDDADVQDNDDFIKYFKGLALKADTSFSRSVQYFRSGLEVSMLRLHYRVIGTFSEEKYIDFPFSTTRQFNNVSYSHTGTPLSVFTPFKKQLKASSVTGNKAYLHNSMLSYVKISFPSLLKLKELYPYVKVMKAELVITPSPGSYKYPYELPSGLSLFRTDENNNLIDILADIQTQTPLNGNLYIDHLYGESTNYSYEITGYINALIDEGRFSKSALMLVSSAQIGGGQLQRLVINDQTLPKGIQLKLYLLGL